MGEKDKIIADRLKLLAEKDKKYEELNKLISELLLRIAKLEKDTSTSSKPLFSGIVVSLKSPPLTNSQKRKYGG